MLHAGEAEQGLPWRRRKARKVTFSDYKTCARNSIIAYKPISAKSVQPYTLYPGCTGVKEAEITDGSTRVHPQLLPFTGGGGGRGPHVIPRYSPRALPLERGHGSQVSTVAATRSSRGPVASCGELALLHARNLSTARGSPSTLGDARVGYSRCFVPTLVYLQSWTHLLH